MSNELIRMQEEVSKLNRDRFLGRADPVPTDDAGYTPTIPLPPKPEEEEEKIWEEGDAVSAVPVTAKVQLEEYQRKTYKPQINGIDLNARTVQTSHGNFPLEDSDLRTIAQIGLRVLQHHFETVLQKMAEEFGVSAAGVTVREKHGADGSTASTASQRGKRGRKQLPE
jgi:hypothetical protein